MKKRILGCWMLLAAGLIPLRAQELKPFVLMPQWSAQAQFAGYYAALEKGFYLEEGLDVQIKHPTSTNMSLGYVLSDDGCDAVMLTLMQAMELMDSNIQLVNILQTSMESSLLLFSRWGVDPTTQKGAKVFTWRSRFGQLAECMASERQLDYTWVQAANGLNIFIVGAVDAALCMSYNEYYMLLQTGLVEADAGVWRFSEHGYNIQEDGVYMTRSSYQKDPDRALRFARASRKGWVWVAEHPEEALDIVMEYTKKEFILTNRTLQKKMLDEILRLQLGRDGQREFRLVPEMVEEASSLMYNNGLLTRKIKMEEILP